MLELFIRYGLFILSLIGFYTLVMIAIYFDQIVDTMKLTSKHGYTWGVAWDVAGTNLHIEKRLKQIRRPK
jgi:hypothetical protein